MEGNVQRVFAILIAVIIFFLLPMYISFEKKDDISYALALKITTNFVESVTKKGYLSREMYDNYLSDLGATDNAYDITFEHIAKKYYPTIYVYKDNEHSEIVDKLDYALYEKEYKSGIIKIGSQNYDKDKFALSYDMSEERYNHDQIVNVINQTDKQVYKELSNVEYNNINSNSVPLSPNMYGTKEHTIYTLNEGDTFTVTIKNTNVTIATVLFNSMTFGAGVDNTTKIYINYGSTVKNEEYKVNNSVNSY